MDDHVKDLLNNWGLEKLLQTFEVNEVDEETFNTLSEEDIKELVPVLGQRKIFLFHYNQYKDVLKAADEPLLVSFSSEAASSTATEEEDSNEPDIDEPVNPLPYPLKATLGAPYVLTAHQNSVRQLLDSSDDGKIIKASYGANKKFLRSKLCELIIKNELKNDLNRRISSERFREIALEINDIFIHEPPEIYYVPYVRNVDGKPKAARGKLWSTYCYLRKNLKTLGIVQKKKEGITVKSLESQNDDLIVEDIQWLKNNSLPFPVVLEKWKLTTHYRITNFPESINDYFNIYKCLKQPTGYILFETDFENLYEDKQNLLINKWPHLCNYIIKIAKAKKDSFVKSYIGNLSEQEIANYECVALLLLPLLFTSTNVKSKKPGVHWRPSKLEMQNGFLLHLKNISDLETQLILRETKLANYKLTAQPIPVIVGETIDKITDCYVCVNEVRYKVDTPVKAVDVCFKLIHSLNAEYPKECDAVWMFIQNYIYDIKTEHDRKYVSASSLIADIEMEKSQEEN